MLCSALKHTYRPIHTTGLPVRCLSKEIRQKDLIQDKKKEHQTHQVGSPHQDPHFYSPTLSGHQGDAGTLTNQQSHLCISAQGKELDDSVVLL